MSDTETDVLCADFGGTQVRQLKIVDQSSKITKFQKNISLLKKRGSKY